MIGRQIRQVIEPPHAHLRQDPALVRDRCRQDPVIGRDPVAGDDKQVAVGRAEQVADLAPVDVFVALGQSQIARCGPRGQERPRIDDLESEPSQWGVIGGGAAFAVPELLVAATPVRDVGESLAFGFGFGPGHLTHRESTHLGHLDRGDTGPHIVDQGQPFTHVLQGFAFFVVLGHQTETRDLLTGQHQER